MLSKKDIKDIQSLSQKKCREELKLFVAEGPKIVAELAELVPQQVERIYAVAGWIDSHKQLTGRSDIIEVTGVELQKLSFLQTPHDVVGVFRQFEETAPMTDTFCLYLDTIQDPGNFGTLIRIADWFGVKTVVCSAGCADLYNPKVVQATMASIARVNVFYDEAGTWLQNANVPVYAAALQGKNLYEQAKLDRGILVIGNESKGVRSDILSLATEKITIPGKGGAESLNAAVAAGIILSHIIG